MRERWIAAWLGGVVLGVGQGVVREALMKDRVGDERAHQFGTAALIGALALYFAALQRRWPLPSRREAIEVGLTWSALTVLFEFGLGRFVTHKSWAEMTADYDLTEGRVWALVPAWMAVGPEAARVLDP